MTSDDLDTQDDFYCVDTLDFRPIYDVVQKNEQNMIFSAKMGGGISAPKPTPVLMRREKAPPLNRVKMK